LGWGSYGTAPLFFFIFQSIYNKLNNMNETIVKIADVEYKVKKTYASLLKFEEITGRGINEMRENVTDLLTLFYCILAAGNINFHYTFDEFIAVIDENEDAVDMFNNYLLEQASPKEVSKKKVTKKQ
jgi:hypothetical protein